MKIICLESNPTAAGVYLVLGSGNRLEDRNTLVDIGAGHDMPVKENVAEMV